MRTGRAIAPPRIPRGRRTAEDSPPSSENRPANPSEWKDRRKIRPHEVDLWLRAIAGPRSEGLAPVSPQQSEPHGGPERVTISPFDAAGDDVVREDDDDRANRDAQCGAHRCSEERHLAANELIA